MAAIVCDLHVVVDEQHVLAAFILAREGPDGIGECGEEHHRGDGVDNHAAMSPQWRVKWSKRTRRDVERGIGMISGP